MSHVLKALFFASILISSGSILPFAFAQNATLIPSPLKQLKNGISAHDVKCKEGFVLIMRTDDGSPACVKPQTAQKLVERGWVVLQEQTVWFEFDPVQCEDNPWDMYWHKLHGNQITVASMLSELGVIKEYFKGHGIAVLDAKRVWPSAGSSQLPCGSPSNTSFYFLISQSDGDKMVNLGYKMFKTPLPSNATWVG